MSETIAILSPHLDDAILSCGGMIASYRGQGSIHVINLFTKDMPSRIEEERRCADYLGYNSILCNLSDSPRRGYRLPFQMYGRMRKGDERISHKISQIVEEIVSRNGVKKIYAPLAVGMHVDHQHTFDAALRLKGEYERLFYEDIPYGLLPGLTSSRIGLISGKGAPYKGKIIASGIKYAGGRPVRQSWFYLEALLKNTYDGLLASRKTKRVVSVNVPELTEALSDISAVIKEKIKAINFFKSHVKNLFHGSSDIESLLNHHALDVSKGRYKYLERYWRFAGNE